MRTERTTQRAIAAVAALAVTGLMVTGCSRDAQAMSPQQLQQRYGIADAYSGQVVRPSPPAGRARMSPLPRTTTGSISGC